MDFLNPRKKRAHNIRLIIGYILIGIAISLVALILVFQSYGYDLDRKTGSIIQNGLLYVAAQPEPANIYLNGKLYKSLGDGKFILPSDIYKIELSHDGYRTWSRTISLAGGSIERYVYPFLFPTTLNAKTEKTYTAVPALSTQSPDHHWLLVEQPGQLGVFDEFDANDSKKAPVTVTVPAGLLVASPSHQLSLAEWSTDNRHFLLQHDYAGGREFIMVDRDTPASSYNVNKVFKANPSQVTLRDKHFDQLYLYDQASHKLNLGDQRDGSVKPVLNNVLAFKPHGADLILYATDEQATAGKLRVMIKDAGGSYFLREIPQGAPYLLDLAQYGGHWYMAAGTGSDNRVYIYQDPLDVLKSSDKAVLAKGVVPESVLRVDNSNWMEFSATAQFIAVESGSQFSVYDAERQRVYKYDLRLPLDAGAPHANWMDGDRLLLNSGGKLTVVDYDGANLQSLLANQPGLVPAFDRQYKLLYTIAPTVGGATLERTNLVVGANN